MPLEYRGYTAYIESEGQELPQYQVEVVDERTVTCWIPSEAGKTFSVCFEPVARHNYKTSETSRQSFLFSEVNYASDEDAIGTRLDLPVNVATIELAIWSASKRTHRTPRALIDKSSALDNGVSVSERSKLVGANHVKPGAIQSCGSDSLNTYSKTGKQPYAVFIFKHRPPAVLQAMGIMPRPAQAPSQPAASTPTSTSRKRSNSAEDVIQKRCRVKEEELDIKPETDDELEAKRRRLQAEIAAEHAEAAARQARAAVLQVQLEEAEAAARARRGRVKSERPPSPIGVPQPGEVIDLTDD